MTSYSVYKRNKYNYKNLLSICLFHSGGGEDFFIHDIVNIVNELKQPYNYNYLTDEIKENVEEIILYITKYNNYDDRKKNYNTCIELNNIYKIFDKYVEEENRVIYSLGKMSLLVYIIRFILEIWKYETKYINIDEYLNLFNICFIL